VLWEIKHDFHLIATIYNNQNQFNFLPSNNYDVCINRFNFVMSNTPWLWKLLAGAGWTPFQDKNLTAWGDQNHNWQQVAANLNRPELDCQERYAFIKTPQNQKLNLLQEYYAQDTLGIVQ
jgi:hypothetical protein